jgi:hypothetical protein
MKIAMSNLPMLAGSCSVRLTCRHDRDEFYFRIQAKKETFGHIRYLRRILHVHDEKAASFSPCGEKVSRLGLQVFDDLMHDFFQLASADGGVAGLNGQRELYHNAHSRSSR